MDFNFNERDAFTNNVVCSPQGKTRGAVDPDEKTSRDDDTQIRHSQRHEVRVHGGTAGRSPEPTDDDDGHDVAEHTQEYFKWQNDLSSPDRVLYK